MQTGEGLLDIFMFFHHVVVLHKYLKGEKLLIKLFSECMFVLSVLNCLLVCVVSVCICHRVCVWMFTGLF